ncbi:hypothetical protein Anas_13007 [Armadillidium nasatum]|uniref:Uncharacterized protein n=1 Tax=Armadillidium nasatum TaxID=96803 RepID=A0A5N5T6V7_9CRUS|nr:hypothetical protein Anas_13007 [Armadillidium nasatum]
MKIFKLPRFARRFIRRHTEQIPLLKSIDAHKKLSILYSIITWNLFGYLIYKLIKKNLLKGTEGWWEGNVYGMDKVKNIQTYRVDGFNLVEVKDPEKGSTENKEN